VWSTNWSISAGEASVERGGEGHRCSTSTTTSPTIAVAGVGVLCCGTACWLWE
ncbi:hypothetical protein SARC_14804, partial [Sphaeroforma arctica JP610]